MISKKMEKALNGQINKELYSAYLYLSMGAYAADVGMAGVANWMKIQYQEETAHAMKFLHYMEEQGGRVQLAAIEQPPVEFDSVRALFDQTLEHEQFVTKCINELVDLAISEKDHATNSFLQWFVNEQVEEESSVKELLDKFKLIGDQGHGLLMIDSQLAGRTYTPPAASAT